MSNLIYILILIVDVVVILDVLKTKKDGGQKILWIILVLILPLLGPILYYVIGKK
jgi:hypothetical protein